MSLGRSIDVPVGGAYVQIMGGDSDLECCARWSRSNALLRSRTSLPTLLMASDRPQAIRSTGG